MFFYNAFKNVAGIFLEKGDFILLSPFPECHPGLRAASRQSAAPPVSINTDLEFYQNMAQVTKQHKKHNAEIVHAFFFSEILIFK